MRNQIPPKFVELSGAFSAAGHQKGADANGDIYSISEALGRREKDLLHEALDLLIHQEILIAAVDRDLNDAQSETAASEMSSSEQEPLSCSVWRRKLHFFPEELSLVRGPCGNSINSLLNTAQDIRNVIAGLNL